MTKKNDSWSCSEHDEAGIEPSLLNRFTYGGGDWCCGTACPIRNYCPFAAPNAVREAAEAEIEQLVHKGVLFRCPVRLYDLEWE
jgi:hypothetical protein